MAACGRFQRFRYFEAGWLVLDSSRRQESASDFLARIQVMLVLEALKLSIVAAVLMSAIAGCANTPPSVQTNERPSILDHPSVLGVSDHDPETTTNQFLDAMEREQTFGYCLPVGSPRVERRPIACFITELGDVYVVIDHSQEEKPYSLYEIGPAVRKSQTRYYLPLVDAEIEFERN